MALYLGSGYKQNININFIESADESSKVAQLNIAYGDAPPEETDKLWVQTDANNVSKVIFSNNFKGGESYEVLSTIQSFYIGY